MKFLVGYNGSNEAENALKLAHKHAAAFDAEVDILISLEQSLTLQRDDIEKTEDALEKLKTPFTKDQIHCEAHVSVSHLSAGEDVVQFIKDNDIDQVFIGVRKKSKVGKFVFGSTAQYVLLQAPCPVVTVK